MVALRPSDSHVPSDGQQVAVNHSDGSVASTDSPVASSMICGYTSDDSAGHIPYYPITPVGSTKSGSARLSCLRLILTVALTPSLEPFCAGMFGPNRSMQRKSLYQISNLVRMDAPKSQYSRMR